jgi:hypothetical protein
VANNVASRVLPVVSGLAGQGRYGSPRLVSKSCNSLGSSAHLSPFAAMPATYERHTSSRHPSDHHRGRVTPSRFQGGLSLILQFSWGYCRVALSYAAVDALPFFFGPLKRLPSLLESTASPTTRHLLGSAPRCRLRPRTATRKCTCDRSSEGSTNDCAASANVGEAGRKDRSSCTIAIFDLCQCFR